MQLTEEDLVYFKQLSPCELQTELEFTSTGRQCKNGSTEYNIQFSIYGVQTGNAIITVNDHALAITSFYPSFTFHPADRPRHLGTLAHVELLQFAQQKGVRPCTIVEHPTRVSDLRKQQLRRIGVPFRPPFMEFEEYHARSLAYASKIGFRY